VPDVDYEAAAAEFDQKQLADLTIAIGLINASFRAPPAAASNSGSATVSLKETTRKFGPPSPFTRLRASSQMSSQLE
jgi:hypothetical protein